MNANLSLNSLLESPELTEWDMLGIENMDQAKTSEWVLVYEQQTDNYPIHKAIGFWDEGDLLETVYRIQLDFDDHLFGNRRVIGTYKNLEPVKIKLSTEIKLQKG